MTILGDVNVVFDTHTSNIPVLLQNFGIDVFAGLGRVENWVDDEAAEVDL